MILQRFPNSPIVHLGRDQLVKWHILKLICTHTSISNCHSDPTYTIGKIISIIREYPRGIRELEGLSSSLTTLIVESVLKGLRNWKAAHFFFSWASNQNGYRHNIYTYNTMAEILSRVRQNAPLKSLAVDIVYSQCPMSPGALGFFIRCMGAVELAEEANSLFEQVKMMGLCYPNNYSYTCLIEALSKSGNVHLMELRLNEMHDMGWKPDKYTMTSLIQGYCNAHQVDKALDVFCQILGHGWVDGHVLCILVLSFSKSGEVDRACELVEMMESRGVQLNEKTCFVLIHGFVRVGRVDNAFLVFDKMRSLGFAPDISIFDVLIGGLCNDGNHDRALPLFSSMLELGISPDVRILMKFISSLSFNEKGMLEILMKAKDIEDKDMTRLFNMFLSNLVEKVSVDRAFDVLHEAMRDGLKNYCGVTIRFDATSFRVVYDGLLQANKPDAALSLLKDIIIFGIKPDTLMYNNIINCFSDLDRLEKCNELLREMRELGLVPTEFTYNSIYGCLCKQENVEGAVGLLNEMRVHGHKPWIKHSTLLVKKLCKWGRPEEACIFLDKMIENGFVPDMITYSAAFDGFLKVGEVNRGLELFMDIWRRGYSPDVVACNTIISGLAKSGRLSQAEDMISEMLAKGIVPSVVTHNLLIDGCCKNGEIDKAILYLSKMSEVGREPNIITYTTIIDGICTARRPNAVLGFWGEMMKRGVSPNRITYMALIHGLCKCENPGRALTFLREMDEKEMKPASCVYIDLLCSFVSMLDYSSAVDILEEMIQKGHVPKEGDKRYLIVKEAVTKLSEHVTTSSHFRRVIADSGIILDNALAVTS